MNGKEWNGFPISILYCSVTKHGIFPISIRVPLTMYEEQVPLLGFHISPLLLPYQDVVDCDWKLQEWMLPYNFSVFNLFISISH